MSIATTIYLLLREAQLAPPRRKVEAAPVSLSVGQKAHKSISSCQAHRSGNVGRIDECDERKYVMSAEFQKRRAE